MAKIQGVTLGKNCNLNKNVSFGSEPYLITLGDNFYCSSKIQFITHDGAVNVLRNLYPELAQADLFGRITIGDNVFLGYNVTILPNSCVGNNVIIGAGSIVRGNLESGYVYAGAPVKKLMSIDEYKSKVESKLVMTKNLTAAQKLDFIKNKGI
ncbi:acyltransferase [Vibrio breoganii]